MLNYLSPVGWGLVAALVAALGYALHAWLRAPDALPPAGPAWDYQAASGDWDGGREPGAAPQGAPPGAGTGGAASAASGLAGDAPDAAEAALARPGAVPARDARLPGARAQAEAQASAPAPGGPQTPGLEELRREVRRNSQALADMRRRWEESLAAQASLRGGLDMLRAALLDLGTGLARTPQGDPVGRAGPGGQGAGARRGGPAPGEGRDPEWQALAVWNLDSRPQALVRDARSGLEALVSEGDRLGPWQVLRIEPVQREIVLRHVLSDQMRRFLLGEAWELP